MENSDSLISLGLVYHLAIDVINALEFLHDHGVNHNNVRPENILLIHRPGVSVT